MDSLNITMEDAISKIMENSTESYESSRAIYLQLLKINTALYPCIREWINGTETNFFYEEISLADIQNKLGCSYIKAVLIMSAFIDNHALINLFNTNCFLKE